MNYKNETEEIIERIIQLEEEEIILFYCECPKLTSSEKYKKHRRLGRKLLAYALKKLYNLEFDESMIVKNKYGKPKLKDFPNIHFNISHSDRLAILALSKSEIGVDVEDVYEFSEAMIERVFSEAERKYEKNFSERNEYFTRLWTIKESFFKCKGSGLIFPLSDFSISLTKTGYPIELTIPEATFFQDKVNNSIVSVCHLKNT